MARRMFSYSMCKIKRQTRGREMMGLGMFKQRERQLSVYILMPSSFSVRAPEQKCCVLKGGRKKDSALEGTTRLRRLFTPLSGALPTTG